MDIGIWLIENDRQTMIENQRQINSIGSMRAVCLLSVQAAEKTIAEKQAGTSAVADPSLMILDYDLASEDDFKALRSLRQENILSGVPVFLAVEERSEEIDTICYEKGAMVVVHKHFSKNEILRIERTAWQYENTRQYERLLQQQAAELKNAKEIFRLNQQLKSRNELLHRIFDRYFSDEVVEVILNAQQEADISLGGEKREVTVMLTDLRSFTTISETMDSETVTSLLNFYFDKMVDVILRYKGTVIEFLGDGLLAVFGAPLNSENQTENAIAAAIHMQNSMEQVALYCRENAYPEVEMGIGLHRGEVFIGNIGSERMMRYNVIGSTVNECSRIESCSVGGQILVSKEILDAASCPLKIEGEGTVNVKGMKDSLSIYELSGIGGEYECSLNSFNTDRDRLTLLATKPRILIYPLQGKMISEEACEAEVISISEKRAVIRTSHDDLLKLPFYTNVKISPAGAIRDIFPELYAKVAVGIGGEEILERTLHFTDTKSTTSVFVKWALKFK